MPSPIDTFATSPSKWGRQYRFLALLGSGGFGEVYLAEAYSESGFRKRVAIKVLKSEWANNKEIRGRLHDEAAVLGLLRHPNIVSADNLVVLGGQPALIMEYVPGVNLSAAIRLSLTTARMSLRAVGEIGAAIGSALDAAYWKPATGTNHPIAVLHRDIKPGNIRLTPHGEVKLLDFGISRSEVLNRSVQTVDHQPGSLGYMAPEVLSGGPATPASDVYALGVVLMECLSVKRFGWAGASQEEHQSKVHNAVRRLKGVPLPLCALLEEILSHDPQRRPRAAAVAKACQGLTRTTTGDGLREWCAQHLSTLSEPSAESDHTGLVGRIFSEDDTQGAVNLVEVTTNVAAPAPPKDDQRAFLARHWPWILGSLLVVSLLNGSIFLFFVLAERSPAERDADMADIQLLPQPVEGIEAAETEAEETETATPVVSTAVESTAQPAHTDPAPAPTAPSTTPSPSTTPPTAPPVEPAPQATPSPAPAAPPEPVPSTEVQPDVSSDPLSIRLASIPLGLPIWIDGVDTGKRTPAQVELTVGSHAVRFGDAPSVTLQITNDSKTLWTYDQVSENWRR